MSGTLYGIGVGPGDPELLTLKAARILRETRAIAYFSKHGKPSHAQHIASSLLREDREEMPLHYPVTTEVPVSDPRYESLIGMFYEEAAKRIAGKLSAGENVALLAAGDPFFYGSFMHLYRRISSHFPCEIVPGIPAMVGGWSNARAPITWGDDILTVLPGTLDSAELTRRLRETDAAVIMKLGRNLPRVRQAIADAGMLERATYIEYATMEHERILPLNEKTDDAAPYFSLIVIPGEGRRL